MLGLFYQYLIRHHRVVLPGLGTVVLQRKPAVSDFTEHIFLPPSYSFLWEQGDTNPSTAFFVWLSHKLNIAEEEAAIRVTNFVAELKRQVNAGKEIIWEGVGTIRRGPESAIEFEPVETELTFENKVHGEKVIHENSTHTLLVGDKEKTSLEMTEILHLPAAKRFDWVRIAMIAAVLSILFIIAYIWKNGLTADSVSNQKKNTPNEASPTYQPK